MLDSVFIKLLAEKDDAAYKELFARYYDSLKGLAFTYVKDSATAEDLVQDLFLALYYGGQKFDSVMGLKYYLFRSLKNGILNYLKKEGLRRRYEQQMMQGSEPMEDYWEKAMEEEVFVRLNDAVDRLPEQCRKVMRFTLEGPGRQGGAGDCAFAGYFGHYGEGPQACRAGEVGGMVKGGEQKRFSGVVCIVLM